MRSRLFWMISVMVILAMMLTACGGTQATEAPTEAAPAEVPPTEAPEPTAEPEMEEAPADRVQIRWFVGLGTGQQPEQVEAQEAVVEAFNASQDKIELVIEIVNYEVSVDTLSTQIAAGNAPDIVGPVGVPARTLSVVNGLTWNRSSTRTATTYPISTLPRLISTGSKARG